MPPRQSMTRRHLTPILLLAGICAAPGPAEAACSPLSLCSCSVSTTGIAFGNYNPVAGISTDSSGSIRVQCILLLDLAGSYTIALSPGGSASYVQRRMSNGGSLLGYNLYIDSARSQIWGDGTGVSQIVTNNFAALLAVDQTTPIYGRIPAGQNVAAGSYADSIIVTITF